MSGHTPGPWSTKKTPFYNGGWEINADGYRVAMVPNASEMPANKENASLIAAAPDGLALAQYAVDNPNFDSSTFDQMARAFITKATGAQP